MKKLKTFFAAFIMLAMGALVLVPAAPVAAEGALDAVCVTNPDTAVCKENSKSENDNADSFIKSLVNTLLYVVGALSVVMIIIGGILYVVSHGDSSNITKAKNTILYAVVGLIVSLLAFAIVNYVLQIF